MDGKITVTWKYVKPLKAKDDVKSFLKENSIDLPGCLVSLIENNNGGRPSAKDFITSDGVEHVFKSLLSYNADDSEPIYSIYDEVFSKTSLYPIGTDPAGNFICFDRKERNYCYWNHETNMNLKIIQMSFLPVTGETC